MISSSDTNKLLLTLTIFGVAICVVFQPPVLAQSQPVSAKPSKMRIVYDKANNETTESVPLTTVMEVPGTIEVSTPHGNRKLPSETLQMTAYFSYPGKTFVRPENVMLAFLAVVQDEPKYKETDEVAVRVDSQSLSAGKLHVADQHIDTNMPMKDVNYWRQTFELSIKTAEFLRIADSKKVTVKLGNTEINLSAQQIKHLRALAVRVGA